LGLDSQIGESGEEDKEKSRGMREEEEKMAEMRKEVATERKQNLRFFPLFSYHNNNFLLLSLNVASELLPPESRAVTEEGNRQCRRQMLE
jgi:hypothetical protein